MKDKATCPMCLSETGEILATTLRRGEGTVFRCAACDLGFLDPAVPPTSYTNDYRARASHKADGSRVTAGEQFRAYAGYQKERLARVLPCLTPKSSVLEVGAGAGQFLVHLATKCARRVGIEPDADSKKHLRTIGIEAYDTLADLKWNEDFDVVTAFQVLEHSADPVELLDAMKRLVKHDGTVIVEVPNLNDALRSVWKVAQYEAFYFHVDHRFYFTRASLEAACRKAGFRDIKVEFSQDYSVLNHLHWLMNREPQKDCHAGLGEVHFSGAVPVFAEWLTGTMRTVDRMYRDWLIENGCTSNLVATLKP